MTKDKSNKIDKKWKSYITGIITSNFMASNKTDKYFRYTISDSTSKAIQANWIRILGIDYEIISMNLCKENKHLGIALEGVSESRRETNETIHHHYLKHIMPNFCIGLTKKFNIRDELLEINGLKLYGLTTKEVVHTLRKVTNYFQIVVARSIHEKYDMASDYGGSEDNLNSPISFYDMDDDESSQHGTLRSVTSNYSTTSRDFGSSVSVGGLIDGQYENVVDYLKNIVGWRGPVVIEFRKQKERFGLALEEIKDPKSSQVIIVFKIIAPKMIAGKDGRLHAGDRLLQVNGKSVNGIPFKKVCQWIKSAPGGRLVICICKPHFEPTNYDHSDTTGDNHFYNTLKDADKLPKLSEETDGECVIIPPAPEDIESYLILKRVDDKLGIFLDIVDGGINGARIKKISRGIVKDDGTLREGDFIRKISGICLNVDDKVKLDYCLRQIAEDTNDYNICYITAEALSLYKRNYLKQAPIKNIYPDPRSVKSEEDATYSTLVKNKSSKLAFQEYDITIVNDHQTRLGLVISPSLKEPTRFITIIDIHSGSLADKSGSLKINDDILMVNETNLENVSAQSAGKLLCQALKTQDSLNFKVRRLVNVDDENENKITVDLALERLVVLPDIYSCTIERKAEGYGFSITDSGNKQAGANVEKIYPNGSACKVSEFRCGGRFVLVNQCDVINSSKEKVFQIIKNSSRSLQLVMEMPKFQEIYVKITKDSSMSLGLNVGGGIDTNAPLSIIESLVENRTSKFSEDLFSEDLIVEVDDKTMIGRNHNEVIQILRATPQESLFKIWRRIPFIKRDLLDHYEYAEFPFNYLQSNQYSTSISKPVDDVSTFGISFVDVIIIDQNDNFKELGRYKTVKCVESNSLAEKYAPQIKPLHYLISIDDVPVDSSISCQDLKDIIDSGRRVNLVLSKDIPYKSVVKEKDYDSPILLSKNPLLKSHSDTSSQESLVNVGEKTWDNINTISDTPLEVLSVEPIHSTDENLVEDHVTSSNGDGNISESVNVNSSEDIIEVKQEDNIEKNSIKSEKEITDDSNIDNNVIENPEKLDEDSKESDLVTSEKEPDNLEKPNEVVDVDKLNEDSNESDLVTSENLEKPNEVVDVDKLNEDSNESDPIKSETEPEKSNEVVDIDKLNEDSNESDLVTSEKEPENLDKPNEVVDVDKLNEDSNESDPIKSETEPEKSNEIVDVDKLDLKEDKDESKNIVILPNNEEHSGPSTPSELGINVDHITVPRLENVELGFHVYGGVNGGPNGESFPVFVVSVERDTCNWPADRNEPYLRNGQNLLELNGTVLPSLTISKIEQLIQETKGDLNFKVLNFK